MGWPKKNEQYRLYKDKDGSYLLIELDPKTRYPDNSYSGLANLVEWHKNKEQKPCLVHTSISPRYIAKHWLKRFQWDELPLKWQKEFRYIWFDVDPIEDPHEIRGLWRVENFKKEREVPDGD